MPESPESRALINVPPDVPPRVFSRSEEQIIGRAALSYLQRNGYTRNRQRVTQAGQVMMIDVLPRGFLILGPNATVQKAIKAGLADREAIFSLVDGAMPEIDRNFFNAHRYAFSEEFMEKTRAELNNFALSPNISGVTEAARLITERDAILPVLAEQVINAIPKEMFPNVSMDILCDPRDPGNGKVFANNQARLVRNSMVSTAYGFPTPILPVSFLEKLDPQDVDTHFTNDVLDRVLAKFSLDEELRGATSQYLTDLFEQTRRDLINAIGRKTQSGKSIYMFLRDTLFINPPELEADLSDKWRDAVLVEGKAVVNEEMLALLLGQAQATKKLRRVSESTEEARYSEGLTHWGTYRDESEKDKLRQARLEKEAQELQEKINMVSRGVYPEDFKKVAIERLQILMGGREMLHDVEEAIDEVQTLESVQEISDRVQQASTYLQNLLDANHGTFPDQVTLDQSVVQTYVDLQKAYRRERLYHAKALITKANNKLQTEEIFNEYDSLVLRMQWDTLSASTLKNYGNHIGMVQGTIRAIDQMIEHIQTNGPMFVVRVDDMLNYVNDLLQLKRNALSGDYRRILEERLEELQVLKKDGTVQMFAPTDLYEISLERRRQSLKNIETAYERIMLLESAPDIPEQWSSRRLDQLRKEFQVAVPSDIQLLNKPLSIDSGRTFTEEYLPESIQELGYMLQLRKNIVGRHELSVAIQTELGRLSDEMSVKQQNRSQRKRALETVLAIVNDPLFPSEGEGLPGRLFWVALHFRGLVLQAHGLLEAKKDAKGRLEGQLAQRMEADYIWYMRQVLASRTRDLDYLRSNPAVHKFLDKMEKLGLVQEQG